jgi:hypothetical protein
MSPASAGSVSVEETLMADGKGCKCAAYDESECGCDADWTPQELVDARAEIERLRATICAIAQTGSVVSLPRAPEDIVDVKWDLIECHRRGFREAVRRVKRALDNAGVRWA